MDASSQLQAPVASLPPGERATNIQWIGDWEARVGLDAVKRKIVHCRELNLGRPARRYTN
jgi:hypothetical protein